jgi:peroxiredoxin
VEVDPALRAKGGRLLAISVDPPELSSEVIEEDRLPFPIIADTDGAVIRTYGLMHAAGGLHGEDIAIPAQLLVARDGTIVWRHVARRIQDRVHPEQTLAALERL